MRVYSATLALSTGSSWHTSSRTQTINKHSHLCVSQNSNMFKTILIATTVLAYAQSQSLQGIVVLRDGTINGTVTFTQTKDGVQVQGSIAGLADGKHGFHVHQKGDLSNGCTSTLGHFNPDKKNHGAPDSSDRHVGDLGNIESLKEVATIDVVDKQLSLEGKNSIIGRAVVVHAGVDDLGKGPTESDTLVTGNAGGRLICGIIGLVEDVPSGAATNLNTNVLILSILALISTFGILFN